MEERIESSASSADVASIVRKRTQGFSQSFAEMQIGRRGKDGCPYVAEATLFVSHAQACSFIKLLDAVDAHMGLHKLDRTETYLWLDLFSGAQL